VKLTIQFVERSSHSLDQVQGHRRGAPLRRKDCRELEVDPWQEATHDNAAGRELLGGERIAERDPEPGRHHAAHDLRQGGLDPQHAVDIVALKDLVDQMPAG